MDKKDILKKVDHTLLGQTATWDDIRGILDDIKDVLRKSKAKELSLESKKISEDITPV